MDLLHHQHRRRQLSLYLATVAFLLLSSVSVLGSDPSPIFSVESRKFIEEEAAAAEEILSRRRLGGPGSSPPSCRSKCGRCMPCIPVHVPIQPGFSMPLEYYPEAWRCKCGNKLFMP
ncbi:EPIDERMAL PATTERNING FACTOR-like protein 5 [Henckelia pumila]|uniref:EPIDERMAL PATTERNING FACTOR-like protein 5 n=1 Tax=Henckelia pumila TaxID=405737 RepID=UPI003C6E67F3